MNRRVLSAVVAVCCIMLFPVDAYSAETCYTRFTRLSVNELVSGDKSFALEYSRTNYLKRLEAEQGADTKVCLTIDGNALRIKASGKKLKIVRPFGLTTSLNRAFSTKKNKADKKLDISGMKNGFYSAGLYFQYKGGSTGSFHFYLDKETDGSFFYSPGQYYNDELIDDAETWYKAVGRDTVNAAYTENMDPAIARKAAELTASDTDDEKAEDIYNWITKNFKYDYEYSVYDPVICFREKRGVCNAIAQLYSIMCNAAGVPCLLVYGESIDSPLAAAKTSTVQNHAWTLVYTDGEWRYCDPTWDVGNDGRREYYMTTSVQSGIDHIAYSVFVPDPTSNTALFFHDWGKCQVMKPATASASGLAIYTCTRCGSTKTVVIPASGKSR